MRSAAGSACGRGHSPECPLDRLVEDVEAPADVGAKMHAQRAAISLRQDPEVAARLGGLHHAKAEAVAGDRQILSIIAGQLQEDAAIRSAFVGLSGRMEEARTEADAGGHAAGIADGAPDRL